MQSKGLSTCVWMCHATCDRYVSCHMWPCVSCHMWPLCVMPHVTAVCHAMWDCRVMPRDRSCHMPCVMVHVTAAHLAICGFCTWLLAIILLETVGCSGAFDQSVVLHDPTTYPLHVNLHSILKTTECTRNLLYWIMKLYQWRLVMQHDPFHYLPLNRLPLSIKYQ